MQFFDRNRSQKYTKYFVQICWSSTDYGLGICAHSWVMWYLMYVHCIIAVFLKTSHILFCINSPITSRAVNFWELLSVSNQKISIFHPSNCAVLTLRKSDKQKNKSLCALFFSCFNLCTFVCRRFYMFHSFSWERCLLCGRFYMLGRREREKQCPGGRLPLSAGELTAL